MNKQEELQQAYVIEVCNQINITTCRLQRLQQKCLQQYKLIQIVLKARTCFIQE